MRELLSVAQVARLLNVTPSYVARHLLRTHVLRPIFVIHGRRFVLRATAEAYRARRQKIARKALREIATISQETGLYNVARQ